MRVNISVKLPAVENKFNAKYSRTEKPTGLQYMLLTMIESASDTGLSWGELTEKFGIPEEIFDKVCKRVLTSMEVSGMIDTGGFFDLDTQVSSMHLTAAGRQSYEKGVIATDIRDFSGSVLYVPSKDQGERYVPEPSAGKQGISLSDNSGFDGTRFAGLEPDDIRVENSIQSNKSVFGVDDKEAEVFDVVIDDERKMLCFPQKMGVDFDEVTGEFALSQGGFDDTFVKGSFTSGEIIGKIPESVFESRSKDISFVEWGEKMPGWQKRSYLLPMQLSLERQKAVFVRPGSCSTQRYPPLAGEQAEALECDIASIETSGLGHAYRLVNAETGVKGFEGSAECHLVAERSLGKEEVLALAAAQVGMLDPSSEGYAEKALAIAAAASDSALAQDIVERMLENSKDIPAAARFITDHYRKEIWYPQVPSILEKVLAEKKTPAAEAARVLRASGMKPSGTVLAHSLKTEDPAANAEAADLLLPEVSNAKGVLRELEAADSLAETALRGPGEGREFASKEFRSAANASSNLKELKKIFGMKSLSEYSFDMEQMSDEDLKNISKWASTYSKEVQTLKPVLAESPKMKEIEDYADVFEEFKSYRDENLEKASPRMFGIKLGTMYQELLATITGKTDESNLKALIEEAAAKKLLSEDDVKELNRFREFRNLCAHQTGVPPLQKKDRKRWLDLYNELANPKQEKKQAGSGKAKK